MKKSLVAESSESEPKDNSEIDSTEDSSKPKCSGEEAENAREDEFLMPKSMKHPPSDVVFLKPKPVLMAASQKFPSQTEDLMVLDEKSPAEKLAEKSQVIPYREPAWSGCPQAKYFLEVLRGGVFVENVPLVKPYIVLGRSDTCDMKLENPTISRYHCVIQYKTNTTGENPPGMYLYDLGSTHGTFHNKRQIESKTYCRFQVGHMVKFGRSERLYILHGPSDEEEEPSPYTVTELMKMAAERKKQAENIMKPEKDSQKKEETTESSAEISWGMADDAEEEDEWSVNPFAAGEELNLDDPKKTLKGWFEREGYDEPDYVITELGSGHYKCELEIPLPNGPPTSCSTDHKGKKKDTITQCALQACRLIHERGLLKQSTHESLSKKHEKNWAENDYYDSDEDEFLDRTGSIQDKRKKRQLAHNDKQTVETFESLKIKYSKLLEEMAEVETNLEQSQLFKSKYRSHTVSEDMDDYVHNLDPKFYDKHKIANWRLQLTKLNKDEEHLRKMLNLAKPSNANEITPRVSTLKRAAHLFVKPTPTVGKRKAVNIRDVFPDEDDQPKLKLSKLDAEETGDVKPVPYSKSVDQKKVAPFLKRQKILVTSSIKAPLSPPLAQSPEAFKVPLANCGQKKMSPPPPKTFKTPFAPPSKISPIETPENKSKETVPPTTMETPPLIADNKSPSPGQSQDRSEVEPLVEIIGKKTEKVEDAPQQKLEFKKPKERNSKKPPAKKKEDSFSFEKKYESWMPPPGQTGDGKTSLNEKLGY